jgi:hypothetical protein
MEGVSAGRVRSFDILVRKQVLATALGISLLAFAESQAAEKEFLLSGTRWRLEDVTAEVAVQFQAMRTNRATGGWNVAVKLANIGTHDLHTPLVLSIDSYTFYHAFYPIASTRPYLDDLIVDMDRSY